VQLFVGKLDSTHGAGHIIERSWVQTLRRARIEGIPTLNQCSSNPLQFHTLRDSIEYAEATKEDDIPTKDEAKERRDAQVPERSNNHGAQEEVPDASTCEARHEQEVFVDC